MEHPGSYGLNAHFLSKWVFFITGMPLEPLFDAESPGHQSRISIIIILESWFSSFRNYENHNVIILSNSNTDISNTNLSFFHRKIIDRRMEWGGQKQVTLFDFSKVWQYSAFSTATPCAKDVALQHLFDFAIVNFNTFFECWYLNRDISQSYPPRFRVVQSHLWPQSTPRMYRHSLQSPHLRKCSKLNIMHPIRPNRPDLSSPRAYRVRRAFIFPSLYFHPSFIFPILSEGKNEWLIYL